LCGLGRGFDPARDANRPAERTAVVTELFPGLSGRAFNFPARNRLISGMSAGVAVMEAGGKSGSLITADDATKQGRPVFVPDAVSLPSPGCAALAAKGAGEISCPLDCVTALFPDLPTEGYETLSVNWQDAPEGRYGQAFYGAAVRWDQPPSSEPSAPGVRAVKNTAPEAPREGIPLPEGLSPDAQIVARTLRDGPRYVDEIIEQLGIPAPKVQVAVTELELEDAIAVGPGGLIHLR
ncbi:MAG: DNA-processing protein DprA, partial [Clostridia bacterium]|nr:DNA-processing protein DprA [Clostridia bacterium]